MTLSFSPRINVARRISKAEANLLAMLSDGPTTKGLLPYSGWTDEKMILHNCIAPRLERLKTSFFGPPQPYPALDWWGLAWISGLWRGDRSVSMVEHRFRLTKIELMLNLVGNHDSFKPEFWAEIVQWQLRLYKRVCTEFLEDYYKRTAMYTEPEDEFDHMCRSATQTAVERALAEPEPASPGDVVWTDVFDARVIFHDPTLNAVLESSPVPEARPDKLDARIERMFYDQPRFPHSCYVLEFKNLAIPTTTAADGEAVMTPRHWVVHSTNVLLLTFLVLASILATIVVCL
ncbi:hypothetical protein M407DRAFT_29519 [Tulasnella calospora MUT 4182]|uniref:Uncharacterized protein n=1 Tax=Tulasnella calospora MUT 4182 TaxID=1051891 RepID=A0A0C3Q8V7_9AGAM|nr:hypothetical protein M407DRAFT_29519 [Tulasnella calospora MUT 4182]